MCVLYFDHELSKGDSVLSKVVLKLNFKTHREMCQKVTHTHKSLVLSLVMKRFPVHSMSVC